MHCVVGGMHGSRRRLHQVHGLGFHQMPFGFRPGLHNFSGRRGIRFGHGTSAPSRAILRANCTDSGRKPAADKFRGAATGSADIPPRHVRMLYRRSCPGHRGVGQASPAAQQDRHVVVAVCGCVATRPGTKQHDRLDTTRQSTIESTAIRGRYVPRRPAPGHRSRTSPVVLHGGGSLSSRITLSWPVATPHHHGRWLHHIARPQPAQRGVRGALDLQRRVADAEAAGPVRRTRRTAAGRSPPPA